MKPVGILLAGGLSRRMGGGDKALASLGGRTILERIIARMAPQVLALAINANGDPARFAAFGLPIIPDPIPNNPGPLAGILAGLEWAAREYPGAMDVVTLPSDTPFPPEDLVRGLLAARDGAGAQVAIAASLGRRHPVIGLWPATLAPSLRAAIMEKRISRVSDFVDLQTTALARFEARPFDPFHNVNTSADLLEAERFLVGE